MKATAAVGDASIETAELADQNDDEGDPKGLQTDRPLMAETAENEADLEKGVGGAIESEAAEEVKILIEVPEEERCEVMNGEERCPYKAKYECRAFYCCDEYGCERRFCSEHRSLKCFLNDNHEPWPTVCVECENKVACCGWIRCLLPTILVPAIAITLLVMISA